MPRSRDPAVENLPSDRFKRSREGRRCGFRNDRGRIANYRGMRRPCLGSGIEDARDGKPARCCDDHPGDDADDTMVSIGGRGEQQQTVQTERDPSHAADKPERDGKQHATKLEWPKDKTYCRPGRDETKVSGCVQSIPS